MRNKSVGFLVSGIALVIALIVWIFNVGLKKIVSQTCTHGPSCSMYDTISMQTWISLGIAALVLVIGIFLIFAKENEKIVIRKFRERQKKLNVEGLDKDEKHVVTLLQQENGAMFQSSLMENMEIGKVKATRLLDKLEAKQLIERKRRGMNNIVVLNK